MSRKTDRAAAIAVAASLFFTLANAEGSGAFAQESEISPDQVEARVEPAEAPRFVASEVVQPLPETSDNAPEGAIDVPLTLGELVTDMPVDGELSPDMRCLAQAIYFEARGEPLDGQLAVGRVVVNRAESDAFPDDYCGVVTQRAQFSFVKGGHIPARGEGSTGGSRQPDEPFTICDVQFHHPQIAVLAPASLPVFSKISRIFRILDLG